MPADPLRDLLDLPGVADAHTEARAAVDALLGHRVLRRGSAAVSAESALRGARASAALDGAPVELDALRDSSSGPPLPQPVTGALRLSAALGGLVAVLSRSPGQALARFHVLAAAPVSSNDVEPPHLPTPDGSTELGRPRSGPAADDPLDLGPAPPAGAATARLSAVVDLLLAPTRAPAMVLAAVVHAELLTARPFGSADGVVARAAMRAVLIDRGLDPKAVSVPEVGLLELGSAYAAAARDYAAGGSAGVAGWLRQSCRAVELGAREGLAVCEALRRAG